MTDNACDQCDRSFNSPEGLKMHKRAKHPRGKIACPGCGKICGGVYGLQSHMKAKGCGPSPYPEVLESPVKIANRARRENDDFDVIDHGN